MPNIAAVCFYLCPYLCCCLCSRDPNCCCARCRGQDALPDEAHYAPQAVLPPDGSHYLRSGGRGGPDSYRAGSYLLAAAPDGYQESVMAAQDARSAFLKAGCY